MVSLEVLGGGFLFARLTLKFCFGPHLKMLECSFFFLQSDGAEPLFFLRSVVWTCESPGKTSRTYVPPPPTVAQALPCPSTEACLTIVFMLFSDYNFCGQKCDVMRLWCDCTGKRGLDHACGSSLLTPTFCLHPTATQCCLF
jgi:hypothetical protein